VFYDSEPGLSPSAYCACKTELRPTPAQTTQNPTKVKVGTNNKLERP